MDEENKDGHEHHHNQYDDGAIEGVMVEDIQDAKEPLDAK